MDRMTLSPPPEESTIDARQWLMQSRSRDLPRDAPVALQSVSWPSTASKVRPAPILPRSLRPVRHFPSAEQLLLLP